mmetsp:Transcript_3201/g.8176  ORF Transcript_3201/g.8176 Transcript_3201/m.8176 type:complete len:213 (+) Transcript_3201:127-765(+)
MNIANLSGIIVHLIPVYFVKHSTFISTTLSSKSRQKKAFPCTSVFSICWAANTCIAAQFLACTTEIRAGIFAAMYQPARFFSEVRISILKPMHPAPMIYPGRIAHVRIVRVDEDVTDVPSASRTNCSASHFVVPYGKWCSTAYGKSSSPPFTTCKFPSASRPLTTSRLDVYTIVSTNVSSRALARSTHCVPSTFTFRIVGDTTGRKSMTDAV